jgi:hypothetical protein
MPHHVKVSSPVAAPFFAGSLALLAGSATGLWAATPLAAIVGVVALLRVCWIDENIRQDLERADRMPAGYARVLNIRRRLSAQFFGTAPEEITCPRLLASHLRAQGHAIFAFLFGLVAVALAATIGDTPLGLLAAGGALALGLGRIDRLAAADAHLRRREPLPRHLLDDRGLLSRLLTNASAPRRDDAPHRCDGGGGRDGAGRDETSRHGR